MSVDVPSFEDRRYSPDFDVIGMVLEKAEETGEFFELAELAFGQIQSMRRLNRPTPADLTPAEVQTIANCLALAFFALGREFGLPLERASAAGAPSRSMARFARR